MSDPIAIDEKSKNLSRVLHTRAHGLVVFGEALYAAGGTHGPRLQPDIQLVLVLTGSAIVQIDQTHVNLDAGHTVRLLPGHVEHFRFSPRTPTRHSWVSVSTAETPSELIRRISSAPAVAPTSDRLRQVVEIGLEVPEVGTEATSRLLRALALAALEAYAYEGETLRPGKPLPPPLVHARSLLRSRLEHPWTIGELADAAGLSTPHLIRLFRAHVGTTPARYLWQLRIQRGAQLLRDTGLSITEIADQSGFRSPFHFSRCIRQEFDLSPRELRQRYWSGRGQTTALTDNS